MFSHVLVLYFIILCPCLSSSHPLFSFCNSAVWYNLLYFPGLFFMYVYFFILFLFNQFRPFNCLKWCVESFVLTSIISLSPNQLIIPKSTHYPQIHSLSPNQLIIPKSTHYPPINSLSPQLSHYFSLTLLINIIGVCEYPVRFKFQPAHYVDN